MMPLQISVAMATYNGEKFLKEQIESILIQLDEEDELVISDDGSSDDTIKILDLYKNDPRVKLIQNKRQKGFIGNFENAIRATRNPVVLLSDQDDKWRLDKVAIIREEFSNNPRAHLVIHDAVMIDENGSILNGDSVDSFRPYVQGFWKNIWKNTFTGCCMAFSTELSGIFLPFPTQISVHDSWMGLMSQVLQIPIVYIDEPLIFHRRHSQTATSISERSFIEKLQIRYTMLRSILYRRYNMD